jgi:hypothetical protein
MAVEAATVVVTGLPIMGPLGGKVETSLIAELLLVKKEGLPSNM